MAISCYGGRRLSDLLQEQQEPFLLHRRRCTTEAPQRRSVVEACGRRLRGLCDRGNVVGKRRGGSDCVVDTRAASETRRVLCGGKAVPLRWDWDLLAGCFSCGARDRFRRLPRATESEDGGGRQLSPVSVLELHSDDESPALSHWEEEDDNDEEEEPSTSKTSLPTDHDLPGAASPCSTFYISDGEIRALEVEENKEVQRKSGESSLEKEHAIVSGWERIAADISRIPGLVGLDLSGSIGKWRRLVSEEEPRQVGESIEAMIFEEVRWAAVRDMICLHEH